MNLIYSLNNQKWKIFFYYLFKKVYIIWPLKKVYIMRLLFDDKYDWKISSYPKSQLNNENWDISSQKCEFFLLKNTNYNSNTIQNK